MLDRPPRQRASMTGVEPDEVRVCVSLGCERESVHFDSVFVELLPQSCTMESQSTSGNRTLAVMLFQSRCQHRRLHEAEKILVQALGCGRIANSCDGPGTYQHRNVGFRDICRLFGHHRERGRRWRQVIRQDGALSANHQGMFDCIPKFADVAVPIAVPQFVLCFQRDSWRRHWPGLSNLLKCSAKGTISSRRLRSGGKWTGNAESLK